MTHQTHAISWSRYLALAGLGEVHPRTDQMRDRMQKEVAFLAEQLLRALEEFARPHAQRIREARPAPSRPDLPLLAFERTLWHDSAHERVMAATKLALDAATDYPFLRAVVLSNHGEPSRMYSGSNSGQWNNGIGCVFLDLVRPYVAWNLAHLRGLAAPTDGGYAGAQLPSHDSDEHLTPLWERLGPLLRRGGGAIPGWPDCTDGEAVRTCSKDLFQSMYMAAAFLMSGDEADWALCRKYLACDIRTEIGCVVLPGVSRSLYQRDEELADLPYV